MAAPNEAQKARALRLQAQIDRITGTGSPGDSVRPQSSPRELTDQAAAEKRRTAADAASEPKARVRSI
jgi:hypothetical protein